MVGHAHAYPMTRHPKAYIELHMPGMLPTPLTLQNWKKYTYGGSASLGKLFQKELYYHWIGRLSCYTLILVKNKCIGFKWVNKNWKRSRLWLQEKKNNGRKISLENITCQTCFTVNRDIYVVQVSNSYCSVQFFDSSHNFCNADNYYYCLCYVSHTHLIMSLIYKSGTVSNLKLTHLHKQVRSGVK